MLPQKAGRKPGRALEAELSAPACSATKQVWVVDEGRVDRYDGYFEDFREELHKEIAAELDEEERAAAAKAAERAAAKAASAAGGRKK